MTPISIRRSCCCSSCCSGARSTTPCGARRGRWRAIWRRSRPTPRAASWATNWSACRWRRSMPGDRVLVRPGERVPADGVVVNGDSEIDESLITGETARRVVAANAKVYAGSINYSGALTLRVTAAGSGFADRRDRAAVGKGGQRQVAHPAARRPRRPRLCAHGARHRRAHRHRLADRRRLAARRGGDRHRRADHHLPLRAVAGDPRRAGGRFRRAVPRQRHPQCRRRHRAAGGSRHHRLRQDRHADVAGAARHQCRADRSPTCCRWRRGWRCRAGIHWRWRWRAKPRARRRSTARWRSRGRACAP